VKIYNTKTREKEEFKPIAAGKVGIYVCGITVYDDCHIGHARTFAAFDAVVRYLKYQGYQVNFVRNITDIDDKIIARANELKINYQSLVAKYIASMHEDVANLGFLLPNHEPRATEFMPQMIQMVEQLLATNHAYIAKSGDVYYSVESFKNYGQLSGAFDPLQTMTASRLSSSTDKRHEADFVLWKMSKPGEPVWDSPFGQGRPGWHLECSAMSMALLGETFDIHGGGYDLITPHHENECAQSEALSHKPLANYWMHVGFLQINETKMSKSLGNFKTIKQLMAEVDIESLKLFFLSAHYRSFLEYSVDNLHKAQSSMETLYLALRNLDLSVPYINDNIYERKFREYMDDFNTPGAISILFEIAKDLNKVADLQEKNSLGVILIHLAQILNLLTTDIKQYLYSPKNITVTEIEALIQQRNQARVDKNWQQADLIRQRLKDVNIVIEDLNGVTTWRVTHVRL
jgi:cysteinyl-tRNA synthetase